MQTLFGEGGIDWDLIATHLHDMLRVAVSIKVGKISASTILRRLGNDSRKNKLYFAFRKLGRVIRTLFLLHYVDDAEVRKITHAATNKTEELHNFLKWVFSTAAKASSPRTCCTNNKRSRAITIWSLIWPSSTTWSR